MVALIRHRPGSCRVARTVGTLLGKAQRYDDVKAEVNRSMELDELRKMKEQVESAARDVEQSVQTEASFEKTGAGHRRASRQQTSGEEIADFGAGSTSILARTGASKRGAVPRWYKARAWVRRRCNRLCGWRAFRPKPRLVLFVELFVSALVLPVAPAAAAQPPLFRLPCHTPSQRR